MKALIESLNSAFPERKESIQATLTAVVAKEHVVLYGPPGTGKSLLARTIANALGKSYFEYLLTRFTEPSELFGPIDPNAFREGKYRRVTAGKMSEAQVVFLDEIFKANSAILNSMLTILNERRYDAGGGPQRVPLMSMIAASNEQPEGPELAALYDRILVRLEVNYISDDEAFRGMLTSSTTIPTTPIDIVAEQDKATRVTLTPDTIQAIVDLRNACKKAAIQVSDRRWRQTLNLIKAYAHIDARTETAPEDLEILEHVLWDKPSDRVLATKTVQSVISPASATATEQLDAARDLLKSLVEGTGMSQLSAAVKDISEIQKRIAALPNNSKRVQSALDEVKSIKSEIAKKAMRSAGLDV